MPRQRSVGRAPSRPTASAPAPQQHRPATTMAAPPQQHAPTTMMPPQQASQGPGLFGQMASTAARNVKTEKLGMPHPRTTTLPRLLAQAAPQQNQQQYNNCAGAAQNFTKCLDENGGNMQICNWYLEQLKACQAAASQY
ncbi:hypothetical protein A9Z42_0071630 [Trichoderma parareesei]|uniref:CHCH domain-containing protein n=1 Tax=Trichoderma parareesei TaxID=858221 RepID=A0A2H2ZL77_TRIPA|nr:hypothetical protein A9Z42_0071630 [Trichoderma parareesei]